MPIKIPNDLPAFEKLQQEGVRLIGENEALRQDIRPMQVALLNLMPEKPKTETQLARLLGATPLQVELTLLTTSSYRPNTVPLSHLQSFYRTWEDVQERKFDGLIITGAPIEMLPFEEVKYWPELTRILDWSRTHVHSCFHICWGAQAALYHFHGVPKHTLPTKRFGVFTPSCHRAARPAPPGPDARLRRLFPGAGLAPHRGPRRRSAGRAPGSRCWRPRTRPGLCLLHEPEHRTVYMFNHLEYDTYTLHDEYLPRPGLARRRLAAVQLLSRRRSGEGAAQLLARLRAPAVRQLDQRDVPDHALRAGADRRVGPGSGGLSVAAPGTSSRRRARRRAAEPWPGPARSSSSTCR